MTKKTTKTKKLREDARKVINRLRASLREAEHAYAAVAEELENEKLNHKVHAGELARQVCSQRIENVSLRNIISEVRTLIDSRRIAAVSNEDKPQ